MTSEDTGHVTVRLGDRYNAPTPTAPEHTDLGKCRCYHCVNQRAIRWFNNGSYGAIVIALLLLVAGVTETFNPALAAFLVIVTVIAAYTCNLCARYLAAAACPRCGYLRQDGERRCNACRHLFDRYTLPTY